VNRKLTIAAAVAVSIVAVAAFFIARESGAPGAVESSSGQTGRAVGAAGAREAGAPASSGIVARRRAPEPLRSAAGAVSADSSDAASMAAAGGGGSQRAAAGGGSPGAGGGAGGQASGSGSGSSSDGSDKGASDRGDLSAGGRLEGEALSQALAELLSSEEIGPLQGLLISELTADGTHFTPEDVPALFDALMGVGDDFGLQKLALTHLERIDAPPEVLLDGYMAYLESSKKPQHADDVFRRLVDLGGDATVGALGDLLGRTENERMRRQTAEALGALKDQRAVPALANALDRASEPGYSRPYLDALGQIGGRAAYDRIIDYVSRDGYESSLSTLRAIRDVEFAPYLSGSLQRGGTVGYQRQALSQLGQLSDPRTIDDIGRYLDRADDSLARYAVLSLARFSDRQAALVLERYADRHPDSTVGIYARRSVQRVHRNIEQAERRAGEARERAARDERRARYPAARS